jgi:hypothetical protein
MSLGFSCSRFCLDMLLGSSYVKKVHLPEPLSQLHTWMNAFLKFVSGIFREPLLS